MNWTWTWSTGGSPTLRHQGRIATEVASGVWAVLDKPGAEQRVRFETDTGRLIRRLPHSYSEGDGSLSPDGKIWFTRSDKKFVDLATGRMWRLKPSAPKLPPFEPLEDIWGWTGTTEITFVIDSNSSPALVKCDALTLRCAQPLHPQQSGSSRYRDVMLPSY